MQGDAGTGELGRGFLHGSDSARKVALRSPWDLLAVGDKIFVTLAGSHQIATFDPKAQTLALFAITLAYFSTSLSTSAPRGSGRQAPGS